MLQVYDTEMLTQWTRPSLVRMMACRLFGTKPVSEPMLTNYLLDTKDQHSSWFNNFHWRTCVWKCRLHIAGHMSGPQWVLNKVYHIKRIIVLICQMKNLEYNALPWYYPPDIPEWVGVSGHSADRRSAPDHWTDVAKDFQSNEVRLWQVRDTEYIKDHLMVVSRARTAR